VRFRSAGTSAPHGFTGRILESTRRVLAAALSYRDRGGGAFTQIDCSAHPAALRLPLRLGPHTAATLAGDHKPDRRRR
jgi:hypothetical protein